MLQVLLALLACAIASGVWFFWRNEENDGDSEQEEVDGGREQEESGTEEEEVNQNAGRERGERDAEPEAE